ncbi:MAG: hypothetical protein JRH06_04230 [Deltaproteobacteria bacterium]|nr:hypothetical protein [Deltaproteobacteria bacterium]MBW2136747.1 hypothetical protein [Deltaproteobacteria bacterium]
MEKTETKTLEGDVVLVYYQEKPAVYARVEAIEPDVKRDWYRVSLLLLTMPAQPVTWILREEYINGVGFTMGGQAMRIEKVKRMPPPPSPGKACGEDTGGKRKDKPGKVVPFKKQS